MRTDIIRAPAELKAIEPQWDALLGDSDFQMPFFSPLWYQKWFECFGAGKELFVVGAWNEGGDLMAVAPMVKTETIVMGIKVRELALMYNSIAPRNSILYRRGPQGLHATEAILTALGGQSRDWDCIRMINLDATLPYISGLNQMMGGATHRMLVATGRISPFLKMSGDFDDYFQGRFSSKKRNDIRRKINRFHRQLDCTMIRFTSAEDMPVALDLAFRVSKASWKGRIGTDMGCTLANRRFYGDISRVLAQNGQVAIWVALCDGQAVAVQYHLMANRAAYMLITDFDEQYRGLSPGTVLLYHIIKNLYDDDFEEFDLCGDAFQYKLTWTKELRRHVNIRIYNDNPISRMMYLYTTKLLPLIKAVVRKKGDRG